MAVAKLAILQCKYCVTGVNAQPHRGTPTAGKIPVLRFDGLGLTSGLSNILHTGRTYRHGPESSNQVGNSEGIGYSTSVRLYVSLES